MHVRSSEEAAVGGRPMQLPHKAKLAGGVHMLGAATTLPPTLRRAEGLSLDSRDARG